MILRSLFQIIIDSLFPISNTDKLLFSYTKEQAFEKLPKAPQTPIQNTYSVFAYKNDLVTRLVWNIKYKKNLTAIGIGGYALSKKIDEIIPYALFASLRNTKGKQFSLLRSLQAPPTLKNRGYEGHNDQVLLIPIPMSNKRRKERGFNQCELLVDEILQLDKTDRLIACKDLLIRTIHKDRQTLKGREERLEDAKDVFFVNEESLKSIKKNHVNKDIPLKNIPVIIIDDVITTGSTIKEAVETLKNTGFDHVIGISLAH